MRTVVLTDPGEVRATLPGLFARDPFSHWNVDGATAEVVVQADHAFAVRLGSFWGSPTLLGRGDVGQVLALVTRHADVLGGVDAFMAPYGIEHTHPGAVQAVLGLEPARPWVWMSAASEPPPKPGEDRCGILEDAREEIAALLPEANPETHISADADTLWWGYRDGDGRLLSVCAVETPHGGRRGVHLGGFGTHPDARGRGIGTAMMASMTRWGVRHHGFVHYGVWSDNGRAISLYQRLGYSVRAEVQRYVREGSGSPT